MIILSEEGLTLYSNHNVYYVNEMKFYDFNLAFDVFMSLLEEDYYEFIE